jgi:uncharacterized protein YgbK (DUF1537 family)
VLELAVLADDLTGGMITASALEHEGVVCPLVTDVQALAEIRSDAEAVVLASKIRIADADIARSEAKSAVAAFHQLGARRVYYKYSGTFDSTPKGNIGPIAEELLKALGAKQTIFCAALIERDITVYEGRMFIRSIPLADSAKRFDPVTPAFDSNLVAALRLQTSVGVGLLPHRVLFRGRAAAEQELLRLADRPFIVVDATDDDDISRIAELTRDWPLTTGADSLPPALARAWKTSRGKLKPRTHLLPPVGGFSAVISGSCAPQTLLQLDAFAANHPVWRIDLARDAESPGLIDKILDWAIDRLGEGPVAVATSGDAAAIARAQTLFGVGGASRRSDKLLGELSERLYSAGVRKFVVAGGEASGEVVKALGIRRMEVAPLDDMLGGYCHQAGPRKISMVLKPGSYGDANFLAAALSRMEEADRNGETQGPEK